MKISVILLCASLCILLTYVDRQHCCPSDTLWISQKEIDDYGEETGMVSLFREELGTSKLIGPPSQGESLAVVHSASWTGHGGSKRAKMAVDLDPDARIRRLDNEIISTTNVVSSCPFSSRNSFFEQSSVSPEFQRYFLFQIVSIFSVESIFVFQLIVDLIVLLYSGLTKRPTI